MKIPRKASLKKMRGYRSFEMSFFKSLTLSGVLVTTPGQYLGSCIEIKKNINFLGTVDSKAQEFDKAG